MFAVCRSSERPGKEERECKRDFQAVLKKPSFITFIYSNHLLKGEDCALFCCLQHCCEDGKPTKSSRYNVWMDGTKDHHVKQNKPS
jgi:hypothetical protein